MRPSVPTLLLAAALALACGGKKTEEEKPSEAAVLGAEDIVVVGSDVIATGPRISGTLQAARKAVIRAEAAGSVEKVMVEVGEPVVSGQKLAHIEANTAREGLSSARSGVAAAQQDLVLAQREAERTHRLVEAGALAPRDADLADAQAIAARARLEDAKARSASSSKQLEGTEPTSPIAGVISERAVNAGDVVAPGAPLFTVIDPSSLRLEGSVPADAVSSLQVGATVVFQVQGYAGHEVTGTIERIAPAVDPSTRQIPLIVSVPNPDGTLLAGLFAEGRVQTTAHDGLVVPDDAVDRSGGHAVVKRVKDGKVEAVTVEIGLVDPDRETIEITNGISAGDTLLLGAARNINAGTAVEVHTNAAAASAPAGAEG